MATKTVWRTAPPGPPPRYDWPQIAAELRSRPGEWRLIDKEASRSLAGAIIRRKMTALQSDEWDYLVTTRNNTERTAEVWMSAVRKEETELPLPRVTIEGRMAADPELRFTPQGIAVVNFTVATNDRKMNPTNQQWEDGPPCFLRCSAWRETAENITESLVKGDAVVVTGKLTQRQFEQQDGTKRDVIEVQAETVGPSLRWRKTPHGAAVERTQGGQSDPWATPPTQPPAQPPPVSQRPAQPPQQGGWQTPPEMEPPPF